MHPTRRDLLRLGLGSATLLASGTQVPAFLARSAAACSVEPARPNKENILVVVQLDGGNDGLNCVVPHNDPDYRKHRPRLNLARERLHKIDDRLAFHAALA